MTPKSRDRRDEPALYDVVAEALPACRGAIDRWRRVGGARRDKLNLHGRIEPVTAADEQVQDLLIGALRAAWPDVTVVAEEHATELPAEIVADCVVVDPIDGTTSLLAGTPDYAIAVCRVRRGRSNEAVVDFPAYHLTLTATAATGLRAHGDLARLPMYGSDVVLCSPAQVPAATQWARRVGGVRTAAVATASVKMALVATGRAQTAVYLPGGQGAAVWDYAAAALLVAATGGIVRDSVGRDLTRNLPGWIDGWTAIGAAGQRAPSAPREA
ncbi:inositol monophosphatase family protein [Amycolatopsis eburnea]|uniref:inositol-phosphate phosphatase n=1 Tax=Amycolatopsis eburnea TaxID=2267691 RepID=A0A427T7L6_9PSEU|nr:inositol monophosphatase family protein [Amycolatopsis eburnea]RSD16364.1 hypothetical protein EIY87_22190 [Amycolatopsis eburnea]